MHFIFTLAEALVFLLHLLYCGMRAFVGFGYMPEGLMINDLPYCCINPPACSICTWPVANPMKRAIKELYVFTYSCVICKHTNIHRLVESAEQHRTD